MKEQPWVSISGSPRAMSPGTSVPTLRELSLWDSLLFLILFPLSISTGRQLLIYHVTWRLPFPHLCVRHESGEPELNKKAFHEREKCHLLTAPTVFSTEGDSRTGNSSWSLLYVWQTSTQGEKVSFTSLAAWPLTKLQTSRTLGS